MKLQGSVLLESLGLHFLVKGRREGVVLLPARGCAHSPETPATRGIFS